MDKLVIPEIKDCLDVIAVRLNEKAAAGAGLEIKSIKLHPKKKDSLVFVTRAGEEVVAKVSLQKGYISFRLTDRVLSVPWEDIVSKPS